MSDAEKHNEKMKSQKEHIDASIESADQEKGIVLVLTGNGKGKSSSAFGMVARALGHKKKVFVGQFVKGKSDTGEEAFLRQHTTWLVLGGGFTWDTQSYEKDILLSAWL